MVRRTAAVGGLLVGLGVGFDRWAQAMHMQAAVDEGSAVLASGMGLLASGLTSVGVMLLAVAVLAVAIGGAPFRSHPRMLIVVGLGLFALSLLAESGAHWFATGPGPGWAFWLSVEVAWVVRLVAGSLVGLWLAGLLASGASSPPGGQDADALHTRRADS
jgi:hypothetical protein